MSTKQKKLLGHVFCHSIKDIQKSPLSVLTEQHPLQSESSQIFQQSPSFFKQHPLCVSGKYNPNGGN